MNIAVDFHAAEREGTGNCTYIRNLIEALLKADKKNHYTLYVENGASIYLERMRKFQNVKVSSLNIRNPVLRMLLLGIRTFLDRIDILHATYYAPPFYNGRLVLTVHDLSYLHFPEYFSNFDRIKDTWLIKKDVHRADKILTVSSYSKQDIVKSYRVAPEKVEVAYNGASALFKPISDIGEAREIIKGYGINEKYILYVGRINKRKNITGLVEAFRRLKTENNFPHKLVIGGVKDFLPLDDEKLIDSLPGKADIIFTGFIKDDNMPALFGLADVFVYPSMFEGFGLPCLEAMACGCPVISSNTSSIPEVVGDAGILVNPMDTEELVSAMIKVLSQDRLRSEMISKGLEQAKKFTWERAAAKVLEVFEGIGSSGDK